MCTEHYLYKLTTYITLLYTWSEQMSLTTSPNITSSGLLQQTLTSYHHTQKNTEAMHYLKRILRAIISLLIYIHTVQDFVILTVTYSLCSSTPCTVQFNMCSIDRHPLSVDTTSRIAK